MGGRLVLLNSMLANLPIYWLTLAKVPMAILQQIGRISFNFLWSGRKEKLGIHLTEWNRIALLKEAGGWGIYNIFWVYKALHLKSLWRALNHSCLWSWISRDKYLNGWSVIAWIRNHPKLPVVASNIWRGLFEFFPIFQQHLGLQVGNGFQVLLGVEPLIGCDTLLAPETVTSLHQLGFYYLNHVRNSLGLISLHYWFSAVDIGLSGEASREWNAFIHKLSHAGIELDTQLDLLQWN